MISFVGPHRQSDPHPEGFNLCQVLITVPSENLMVLTFGIGWDEDLPWSFKIAGNVNPTPNTTATYACVTWLGMFVGIGYDV
jgi:hypothetical protein